MFPLRDDVPRLRPAYLVAILIALNVAAFAWQTTTPADRASSTGLAQLGVSERDEQTLAYGAIPYRILNPGTDCAAAIDPSARGARIVCDGQAQAERAVAAGVALVAIEQAVWWLTLMSSMFMHGGVLHLAGNMLFLWVFGSTLEGALGRARFLGLYLAGGVAAVYAQALLDPQSTVPTIGASGAVATVLGAYLALYPRARVLTLVFVVFFVTLVHVPAVLLLGAWFLLQLLPFAGQLATAGVGAEPGGIAYLAHIGGFVLGFFAVKALGRVLVPGSATARQRLY